MNSYELVLPINNNCKLIIALKDPLTLIGWNYAEPIILMQNNNFLALTGSCPTYFNIRDLRDLLEQAIKNNLKLHPSINSDIGYLFNGYSKNKIGFTTIYSESGLEYWIGYKYQLWYTYENEQTTITWIYNDDSGNIILKITPFYPYFNCDIKKQKYFIQFKKWILNYKPYFTVTLSHETAQQWLNTAEDIINTIDENEARWKREYEEEQQKWNKPHD